VLRRTVQSVTNPKRRDIVRKFNAKTLSWTLAAVMCSGMASADEGLWLHVKIDEAEGAKVNVNLPIALVEKAMPMIPTGDWHNGHININGNVNWTIGDLRELWQEVRATRDMTFVTVKDRDDDVKVWKEGDYLMVRVLERYGEDAEVNVRIPARVVDALLSGDGEEFDFHAAISALAAEGEGELVTVNENEDRVRVWVDSSAEAE
jgi:hypothetical protein